jgi:EF hand
MRTRNLMIIAAAACIPFAATAAEGSKDKSGSMGPSFDTLDMNHDGRLSQAEASVDATIMFSTADKNSDGYLDKSEFRSRDKTGMTPAPQSLPESSPDATSPTTDRSMTETPPNTDAKPDTETPRQ